MIKNQGRRYMPIGSSFNEIKGEFNAHGTTKVTDLRSALAVLSHYDDELIYTDEPVDPIAELSGVYRYVGAHGTVQRPTRVGPAMILTKSKGTTT